jgi:hypothetical protein
VAGKDSPNALDPIQYWIGLREQYPNLSRLALDVLSIPASSCECERMFSELGDLSQGPKSTVIRVDYFVRDRSYAYGVHI